MTTRTDYTDAEWKLLTDMPTLAAFGAMAAQDGGPVTSTRELWAGMMALAESAKTTYPDNSLIQAVTRSITHHENGAEMTLEDWHASGPEALHQAVVEKTLLTAPEVHRVLTSQATPQEAAEYTAWIMSIARAGVEAAKTGFLGLEGAQITPREAMFIKELAAALNAS
jgi:hypothetical protein